MSLTIIHCAEDRLAEYVASHLLDRIVVERAEQAWIREQWEPGLMQESFNGTLL